MNDRDGRSQPSKPESEERLLARRYMLGGLSAQQQDEVERRFLFDAAFEDIILEEETDLFDALAAGTLSNEHERALRLWASSQQRTQSRLEAAFVFNRLIPNTARGSLSKVPAARNWLGGLGVHRFSAFWLTGVAAAALALVTVTLWVTRRHPVYPVAPSATTSQASPIASTPAPFPAREPAAPSPHAPAAAPAPARSVVNIFLLAEETRSSSSPPRLQLKPGISTVTLQLASQTGLSGGQHAVHVTGADGFPVEPTGVHLRRLHGQSFLEVTLDATNLHPGEYTVLLHQKDTTGASPALTFHFRIVGP